MRRILFMICLFPLTLMGIDQERLNTMLLTAATTEGKPYLETRQGILTLGEAVLPILLHTATDTQVTWQCRLEARICYERIARAKDIEELRRYDWRTHPQYNPRWGGNILGAGANMWKIGVPKCVDIGLWYYYIELTWKETAEGLVEPRDSQIARSWPSWCAVALKNQPEYYYLFRILVDRLEHDETLKNTHNYWIYKDWMRDKESEAVPILIQRHAAYFEREVFAPARDKSEVYRNNFENIFALANSRHADLIEKFISEHPALAPLKDKVAEIRKRPAPPPRAEPPFRLGQQLVNP